MSAATRDGHTLYLALLGSRSMSSRFKESAILLDYGFRVMQAYDKTFATDKSRGFLN
jgi:D-alanyl-D-alanine carboxypeptidase